MRLPGESGVDLVKDIRAAAPDAEVIFITAYASLSNAIQGINGFAFAYLTKPFEMDHLLAVIEKALEKQRLARSLRESEERYRLITEQVNEAIFFTDLDGRVLFGNRRGQEITGHRLEDLVGRTLLSLLSPGSTERVLARLEAIRSGQEVPPLFETEIVRKDGRQAPVEAALTSVTKDGGSIGWLVVARDIAERRRVEREILESEARKSAILEASADAIVSMDQEGKIVEFNRAAEDMFGYRRADVIGKSMAGLLIPPALRDRHRQGLERYLATGESHILGKRVELTAMRADGTEFPIELTVTRILAEGPQAFSASIHDLSESKQLRERLIQSEKLATLGELIAGIAHELNNPLAVVGGQAQLLRMQSQDPATMVRAEKISQAATRASRIVRNFLTAARRHRPERVAVAINEVINESLDLLGYQFRVGNVEVETLLSADLPATTGDPHQIQQVILNLANNAIQAIAASRRRGRLRLTTSLSPDRSAILITVADTGPGIPPEHLSKIFDPFFTTKPPEQGTGLGLAIAHAIVKDHEGSITVESTAAEGTTFVLRFPVVAPPVLHTVAVPARAIPAGLRVLVVDDEDEIRSVISEWLATKGFHVAAAGCGLEAREIIAHKSVDLLVLDIRMPGLSGKDLWQEIRQSHPDLARRTVFCTGDVLDGSTRAFLDEAGCPVVSKPFEWDRFFEAVAEAAAR
jgi:two-component system NtrC family sensor kinase